VKRPIGSQPSNLFHDSLVLAIAITFSRALGSLLWIRRDVFMPVRKLF